jgi:hypothetical protein
MSTNQKTKKALDEKQVLQEVAKTITEAPVKLTIDIKPKNKIHAWLIRHKYCPSQRFYEIKPQRVVNVYRIAGRAIKLDVEGIVENTDVFGMLMRTMATNGEDIFYIVAAAIQNDHREPTDKLIDIVKNEFEMEDILTVMKIAVNNYNVSAFLNSIALMTGIDAVKTRKVSPNENAEKIARSA